MYILSAQHHRNFEGGMHYGYQRYEIPIEYIRWFGESLLGDYGTCETWWWYNSRLLLLDRLSGSFQSLRRSRG